MSGPRRSPTAGTRPKAGPGRRPASASCSRGAYSGIIVDPDNPNVVLWNPGTASFEEAWRRLGIEDGVLAVVGGTDVFALFLSIGYDAFFLTRTLASVPRGRPVFPGVGNGVAAEEPLKKLGLVLRDTRMLDPISETVVQEWGPKP